MFTTIGRELSVATQLTSAERFVLFSVEVLGGSSNTKRLIDLTQHSPAFVRRCVATLEEHGLLELDPASVKPNRNLQLTSLARAVLDAYRNGTY